MAQNLNNAFGGATLIRELLLDAEVLPDTQIFPCVAPEAKLPYIVLARSGGTPTPVSAQKSINEIEIVAQVCAADYDESLALASAVVEALDGVTRATTDDGRFTGRALVVSIGPEAKIADAFVQELIINLKM